MRILIPLLLLLLTVSGPAVARMYQWLDSDSGNMRLSGEPPPWYRSGRNGPRVLVFENGRLVDDTAATLPSDRRRAMRETAFRDADLRREQEAIRKLERAALREARRREGSQPAPPGQPAVGDGAQEPAKDQTPPADAPASDMVEQLKALLSEWDSQQAGGDKP